VIACLMRGGVSMTSEFVRAKKKTLSDKCYWSIAPKVAFSSKIDDITLYVIVYCLRHTFSVNNMRNPLTDLSPCLKF
jgi:hypothetical protein